MPVVVPLSTGGRRTDLGAKLMARPIRATAAGAPVYLRFGASVRAAARFPDRTRSGRRPRIAPLRTAFPVKRRCRSGPSPTCVPRSSPKLLSGSNPTVLVEGLGTLGSRPRPNIYRSATRRLRGPTYDRTIRTRRPPTASEPARRSSTTSCRVTTRSPAHAAVLQLRGLRTTMRFPEMAAPPRRVSGFPTAAPCFLISMRPNPTSCSRTWHGMVPRQAAPLDVRRKSIRPTPRHCSGSPIAARIEVGKRPNST